MNTVSRSDIERCIDLIRCADVKQLTSPTWLEHDLLPNLGLSGVMPDYYPANLRKFCGIGLKSFQQPNQFSKYLLHLSRYKITSYLEVGVWMGGTFIITLEYLSRFNDIEKALAVDIELQEPIKIYGGINKAVQLHEGDSKLPSSQTVINRRFWDLAFIDGDHSYDGCFKDYQSVRDASGIIALHDVCSDICAPVTAVWERLCSVLPRRCVYEFCEQYPEVLRSTGHRAMGIGLIDLSSR